MRQCLTLAAQAGLGLATHLLDLLHSSDYWPVLGLLLISGLRTLEEIRQEDTGGQMDLRMRAVSLTEKVSLKKIFFYYYFI